MKNIWDEFTCSVCDKGFTEEDWDVRHTDPEDDLQEVHEECCSICNWEV